MKTGTIKRIIGPVVDVAFEGELPAVYNALTVKNGDKTLVLEVEQHVGNSIVRAIAMDATDGLARGVEVNIRSTDSVPVGAGTLGRIFNVLGEAIDDGKIVESKSRLPFYSFRIRCSIHKS